MRCILTSHGAGVSDSAHQTLVPASDIVAQTLLPSATPPAGAAGGHLSECGRCSEQERRRCEERAASEAETRRLSEEISSVEQKLAMKVAATACYIHTHTPAVTTMCSRWY